MNPRNPVETFLTEAEDLLGRIEEIALELEPGQAADDLVGQLFRSFHTIKGSGAMFGFEAAAAFTHHVETVLDQVREGTLAVSAELITLILRAKDQIKALLEGNPPEAAVIAAGTDIVTALNALLPAGTVVPAAPKPVPPPVSTPAPTVAALASGAQSFGIFFRPMPELMISGTNPEALLNELRDLGECRVTADIGQVPALDQLQFDHCYLAWNLRLTTNRGMNAIKDVFMFVEDGSEIKIEPEAASVPVALPPAGPLPAQSPGETGAAKKSIPRPASGEPAARKPMARDSSVRVPSERLDRLVNLVGELVMNQSRLSQVAAAADVPNLAAPVEELERLVDELRDNVLGIRMMPIGTTFSRFKRLVHDLSAELQKEIDLVTEGADTELDKTVLDQLGDPLVHLIRNSIDHGIGTPEARTAAGKPRRGTIRLAAAHVGANVIITITDDGRGLDPVAIHAKAVEKGLIAAEARLSERELYDLIFLPGFSTAKQVTGVSGRGVGMDVVKRQFETLRGQVALNSTVGQGTTITLTLPLTLAIIDGLLVEIGGDQFIVPMSVVTENVELHRAERSRNNGRNVIAVRGELVPYLRLRETFATAGAELDVEKIVIARHGGDRVGLVVDRVLGSHQTVIQPLGRFYRDIALVSGATIMGDGRVALILDLAGLVRFAGVSGTQKFPSLSVRSRDRNASSIESATASRSPGGTEQK